MDRIASLNKKGMTLIEVMVALVILLIVSLALMQTALLGISMNLRNSLRDEAVNIADMKMNELRALPYTYAYTDPQLSATGGLVSGPTVTRNIRAAAVGFTLSQNITDISDSKQITILVSWNFKGQPYSHGITSIMRKQ